MLKNPQRIFEEYQRRLIETERTPIDHTFASIEKQRIKLERSISLLIDSYSQEYITKDEFEPRVKAMRQKLRVIQEQQKKLTEQKNLTKDLELIVNNLENFALEISSKLDNLDWYGKRDIIRHVIKRIEIGENEINIVYRVPQLSNNELGPRMQHCCNGTPRCVGVGAAMVCNGSSLLPGARTGNSSCLSGGEHENKLEFAIDLFESTHMDSIPEPVQCYIDYAAFKRDIFLGDFYSIEVGGKTHVFARN